MVSTPFFRELVLDFYSLRYQFIYLFLVSNIF